MKASTTLLLSLVGGIAITGAIPAAAYVQQEQGWTTLFDGKSLKGWIPKIRGYEAGNNFGQTFRVKDKMIQVRYDQYGGKFNDRFGHLFYKTPFSKYRFRCEYRFVGEQLPDGPGWAYKNSGVMIHGQTPESMAKDQEFPVSSEVQLLGGDATGERTTGNLCTPGTNVVMNGKLITQHCTNSKSKTYRGDVWVQLEIEVHGNQIVNHIINGETVLSYEQVQYDPTDKTAVALIKDGKLAISGGTISLQSESHPIDFRNIQIKKID
jgi:hypothetical protein